MSGNAAAIHRARSLRRNFSVVKNVAYASAIQQKKILSHQYIVNVIIEVSIETMLWTESRSP